MVSTPSNLVGRKAVVAKLGMDAHWRGAIVVAHALKEAGMEVVYMGHGTPAEIAATALQEDAVLIGLSTLSGNHLAECPVVVARVREVGVKDVVVALGGTVPPADVPVLREAGVDAVFGPGTPLGDIVATLDSLVGERLAARAAVE